MNLGKRGKQTEEEREKALTREREKKRKKMIRTKYGQTPLRHARKGVVSCIVAATSLFFVVLMIGTAFMASGEVSTWIGFLGLLTLALAVYGLVEGILGFQERDKNYLTCRIGVIVNGVLVLGMAAIFIRGLF